MSSSNTKMVVSSRSCGNDGDVEKKKQKTGSSSVEMMTLDDDCLRAILIRTCASDHSSLRQTCKRFLSIINSFVFRQERANSGYTEVQGVRLLPPLVQYRKDYSFREDNDDHNSLSSQDSTFQNEYDELGNIGEYGNHAMTHFQVFVDGKSIKMERFRVHLLPRIRVPFFEMCDALEGALQGLSVLCFNNLGKLRSQSLKAAVPAHDNRPLLYISEFELPKEYRSLASPVGPMILKSLLTETLVDRWSIAMYIPYNSPQFTEQDKIQSYKMSDILHPARDRPLTKEELQTKKGWENRLEELTQQDMRQFFRAGFHQVKDTSVIEEASNYYLFATPNGVSREPRQNQPILSEKEAMQIKILIPPPDPPKKSKEEKAMFDLLLSNSSTRHELLRNRDEYFKPLREIRMHKPQFEIFDKTLRGFQGTIEELERQRRSFEENQALLASASADVQKQMLETLFDGIQSCGEYGLPPELSRSSLTVESLFAPILQHVDRDIQKLRSTISDFEKKISEYEETAKEEVSKLIADMDVKLRRHDMGVKKELEDFCDDKTAGSSIIMKSCAIHACTYHMVGQPYIQFLLDMMPPTEQYKAINSRDEHGLTPLMVAVQSGSLSYYEEHRRHEMCTFLLDNGADENQKTRGGLTALGMFRRTRKSNEDFNQTFGFVSNSTLRNQLEAIDDHATKLEALIMPAMGPTPADEAIFSEDEISDEDLDEDEDFLDEEEDDDN